MVASDLMQDGVCCWRRNREAQQAHAFQSSDVSCIQQGGDEPTGRRRLVDDVVMCRDVATEHAETRKEISRRHRAKIACESAAEGHRCDGDRAPRETKQHGAEVLVGIPSGKLSGVQREEAGEW